MKQKTFAFNVASLAIILAGCKKHSSSLRSVAIVVAVLVAVVLAGT